MINGFSFNDKHSSDFNLYMKTKNIPLLPRKRMTEETVINRDSSFKFEDGYTDKIVEIDCTFVEHDYNLRKQKLREIAKWLSVEGKLIFDSEPDKYYIAKLYNQIDLRIYTAFDQFTLMFVCYPFAFTKYINENIILDSDIPLYSDIPLDGLENTFEITKNTAIIVNNLGTYEAIPIIEINGTANSITIGSMTINNITKKTYIDCKTMICYTKDSNDNKLNKLNDFDGTFIKLSSGQNKIIISGTNMNCSVFFNFRNTYL